MSIHVTAGKGDIGFCNHWTMEITVVKPLRVYAGMPVGQLLWFTPSAVPLMMYFNKPNAKYTIKDQKPQASEMHRNFRKA
jgi:dCTP deaminase